MQASEMREGVRYKAVHEEMGEGYARRVGDLYSFWDEDGKEKGLVSGDDLSALDPVEDRPTNP
ncbi:MAG: hypothetical protein AUG51_21905 [Acidobacteria bacterium 13_1_20CM_3_53_8]|nr:MAG: hypothetical protein AUG51_21905 [Acidobacteria bacterium 13_1_20CM_3_53_8]